MPKTITCHDAILVFRRNSFLSELIKYEITVRIYHAPTPEIPGRYYVIIRDETDFYDSAWIINIHKNTVDKAKMQTILDEIEESRKPNNNEMIEYKRVLRNSINEGIII